MNNYLAYLHFIGFTQSNLAKIFEKNQNYKSFFENFNNEDIIKFGIKEEKITTILKNRKLFQSQKIDNLIKNLKVQLISFYDLDYPSQLKNLSSPPFLLYVRGDLKKTQDLISVVGSRKNTKYSEEVLLKIIPGLIKAGFGIVSGGAYGVDSLAHKITLENKGYTISVIGTGIDIYYPFSHKNLYENIIASKGAIISIFPFNMVGEAYNFPIRNEIIAGISKGVLVTEAGEKSGTLITVNLALDCNKDVFVIPGDISRETSIGTNKLIRDGQGKLVLNVGDILEEYDINFESVAKAENKKIIFQDKEEEKLYLLISQNPKDASFLSEELNIDIDIISSRLSLMEIKGYIKLERGGFYSVKI